MPACHITVEMSSRPIASNLPGSEPLDHFI